MSESIRELAREALTAWAWDNQMPRGVIDGCGPRLAAFLDAEAMRMPLESFRHHLPEDGWGELEIRFPVHFEGAFSVYRPLAWSKLTCNRSDAEITEGRNIRQCVLLRRLEAWRDSLPGFFERNDVEGLYGAALLRPTYAHWVLVSGGATPWRVSALYGSGDWLIEIRADATDRPELELQLVSAMSSCPWRGWLDAARRTA